MGREHYDRDPADSIYAGMTQAQLFGAEDVRLTQPKYDARYARQYARQILHANQFYSELQEEMRADGGGVRNDAGISLAFARSLEYIIRTPFMAEFPELRAAEFLPLMTEVPPEAATFTYRMLDRMGQAKIIQENGSDAPKVSLKGSETPSPIVTIGASYDYTILDTLRAARMNIPLEAYNAEAARWACEYYLEQIAAIGEPDSGVPGFTNAPGITGTTQVSSGGSWVQQVASIGTASTTNATPPAIVVAQGIISDVNAAIAKVFSQTNATHRPDTMLVTVPVYGALMTAPRSPGFTDDTLLDYIEKACQIQIECWPQLNTAGAITVGGLKGRQMIYKNDRRLLNLVVAQPFTQLPPQPIRMAWEVTTYLRTGGVTVRYPKSATWIDGVG